MKVSNEVKIGLYAVIAVVVLIWGYNFLKGKNLFSHSRTYYVVYKDIDGLVPSNIIKINGYKVGLVKDIRLLSGPESHLLVTLNVINPDIVIPKKSVALISSADLLGSKTIVLKLSDSKEVALSGDTLVGDIEEGLKSVVDRRIAPLQKKAENLIASIDSVMTIVNEVMTKDARQNLSKSFSSIKRALENFEKTSLRIDEMVATEKDKFTSILSKIESITSTIAHNNDKLQNVIKNFSSISDSLAKANIKSTIEHADKALKETAQVMEKINKGEGSLGMLINDKRIYNRLDSASVNLDNLMKDLKENPKRYVSFSVFGGKGKKKK